MKKNTLLTLRSEQIYDGGSDKSKQTAKGTFEKLPDGTYVMEYTEPDAEMGNSLSRIQVVDCEKIQMDRSGAYTTSLTIEQGKAHTTPYRTPFGEMELEIIGNKVTTNLSASGGSIYLDYHIMSNNQLLNKNKLIINIKITD